MTRKEYPPFLMGATIYLLGWGVLLLADRPTGAESLRAIVLAVGCVALLWVATVALLRRPAARPRLAAPTPQTGPATPTVPYERRAWKERRRTVVPVAEERRRSGRRGRGMTGSWD